MPNSSFGQFKRLNSAKAKEFSIVDNYRRGYRAREDKTMLPPGVLIEGSQNVVTNTAGRIAVTKGYVLDGPASTTIAPILSSYDYNTAAGTSQHLRAGFLTSAANDGKLQYRYVDSSNVVTWRDLMTSLTSVSFNFTDFGVFSGTAFLNSILLFVDGSSNVYEWSGGVTTFLSKTATTLTKQGTTTFAQEGFYTTGTHTVVVTGINVGATGGWGTTTLTGIATAVLAGVTAVAGDVIHQKVEVTPNSAITSLPSTFKNDLISSLNNQIYYGSLTSNNIYVSVLNNYKSVAFTAPTRVVGEGSIAYLDNPPTAFIPQEEFLYIFAGKDSIYLTKYILSADLTKESFQVNKLKTTVQQAAQSQALTTKIKNNVVFLSNEPIVNSLGRVDNVVLTPQITDLSYSIVDDINSYDFTNGSMIYFRNFLYLAVPNESLVRIYNMTEANNTYWEAPLTIAVSRFSIIGGDLYGHSYLTSESYKLFTGYNFNGSAIPAVATFAYNNYGTRFASKSFNEFYVEGYISSNTTLNLNINYDLDGCMTQTSYTIVGTDTQIVCLGTDDNSLGKFPLGKQPLGGNLNQVSATALPPKFREIQTFPRLPFYEESTSFSSTGVDYQWEIIGFGPAVTPTSEGNNSITK